MIKKYAFIICSIFLIQSCFENGKQVKYLEKKAINTESKIENVQINQVKNFLKWYIQNMDKLYKIKTIGGGEELENYYVDFNEVEKYITKLRESGFLSEQIIEKEKQSFIEADKNFKINPQNDGPPEGFDFDHFFLTQETFEDDYDNIEKIKYKVIQKSQAKAEIDFVLPASGLGYKYSLIKINSNWLIESINGLNNR